MAKFLELISSYNSKTDGWHEIQVSIGAELPSQANLALKYEKGFPTQLSTLTQSTLSDEMVLKAAEQFAGLELCYLDKGTWREPFLKRLFHRQDRKFAKVSSKGCHRCAQEIGYHRVKLSDGGIAWLCGRCLQEMQSGADYE